MANTRARRERGGSKESVEERELAKTWE